MGQAAALLALVASGCGVSTVEGQPVAAPRVTAQNTTARPQPPVTTTSRQSAPVTTSTTAMSVPESVVRAYFDAINAKDYQRAWALGGKNVGQSYETFAAGFATTARDELTILAVQGNTVTAELTAHQTDGTVRKFRGTYTVTGDAITRFSVREIK